MKKAIAIVLGLALVIWGAVFAYNKLSKNAQIGNKSAYIDPADRKKAPDFAMADMTGEVVKLSDMKGTPVVLNFWASWCPPCKEEMPMFDRVSIEMGGGVKFMMVDLADGERETVENGLKYVREQQFKFPVYFDTKGEGSSVYGIMAIPTTVFIDAAGNIASQSTGALTESALREGIRQII